MKERIKKSAEILNELLKVNYNRIDRYRKAEKVTGESDLKTAFKDMINESKKNTSALLHVLNRPVVDLSRNNATAWDPLLHLWADIIALLSSADRGSILDSCEVAEKVTQTAYQDAISSVELSTEARQLIRNQQVALKSSYDAIKNFRYSHEVTYIL